MYVLLYRSYIVEERSYVPCEDLVYGRMSFKGFNSEVEVICVSVSPAFKYLVLLSVNCIMSYLPSE